MYTNWYSVSSLPPHHTLRRPLPLPRHIAFYVFVLVSPPQQRVRSLNLHENVVVIDQ